VIIALQHLWSHFCSRNIFNKMRKLYSIALLLVLITPFVSCEDADGSREEKLISTFQIVRFPNDPCVGSNSRNGTCYTSQECSDKSGTSAGSCADGFGVCCTFIIATCGSTTSENLTVWTQATTVESGECGLTVCPIDDTICSLRLDFTKFVISGPSTMSFPQVRRMLGHPVGNHLDTAYTVQGSSMGTGCLTDTFYMTSASPSTGPPSLCGTATGEHMYVEADTDKCNYLSFNLADMAATSAVTATRGLGTLATRSWDITITQIECTSATLPPPGCTKYFYNTNAGRQILKSSNWQVTTTSIHLGQQHDRYCIRRERGYCVGCFAAADSEFAVSGHKGFGNPATARNYAMTGGCCGYRSQSGLSDVGIALNNLYEGAAVGGSSTADDAEKTTQYGWDCIIIPGAFITTTVTNGAVEATQTTANMQQILTASPTAARRNVGQGPQICGNNKGIGPGVDDTYLRVPTDVAEGKTILVGYTVNKTICTRSTPFILEFMSDDLEGLGGANTADISEPNTGSLISGGNKGFHLTHVQLAC
jgi:hypothetical protein